MASIERTREICDALREWDSPTVSNAIELLEHRDRTLGFASAEVRCQFPQLAPMVGYAVTCTIDSSTPGGQRPSKLGDLIERLQNAPQPSVVVAQHKGPDRMRSCFVGDLSATLYHLLGAVGAVSRHSQSRHIVYPTAGSRISSVRPRCGRVAWQWGRSGARRAGRDRRHGHRAGRSIARRPERSPQHPSRDRTRRGHSMFGSSVRPSRKSSDLLDTQPLPVTELKARFTH